MENQNTSPKNSRQHSKIYCCLFLSFLITLFVFQFFLQIGIVPTPSMNPTVPTNSFVVSNRRTYIHTDIKKGDIVVFFSTEEHANLIKRVIGTQNDIISFKSNRVFVNGKALSEPYISGSTSPYNITSTIKVPKDSLFLMGDNRENSFDSRKWKTPFVSKKFVIGKPLFYINTSNCSQHFLHIL